MISGNSLPMLKVSKLLTTCRQWARRAGALLVLVVPGLLTACETTTSLTEEREVNPVTGTVYVDTLTVRTSTVLVDSVPTSSSSYLMVGQYQDDRLGTITARSYLRLGLSGSTFTPAATAQFDSLVLVLPTDTYRYGDTTQVQHLEVHRLSEALRPNTTYYALNSRTYAPAPLGTRSFRARSVLGSLRIQLNAALGQELLTAGINRQLSTDEELEARLPGLALTPSTTDNAALLRFTAASSETALRLYYHLPSAPSEALLYGFTGESGARHFYQLQADRRATLLSSLTATRQAVLSAHTAAESYIQGGLGLQTKVEVPYLLDLKNLTGTWVLNSAQLTLETVTGTESRYLAPPSSLTAQLTDRGNHSGAYITNLDGSSVTATYNRSTSAKTNLEQGSYTLALTPYIEAVLDRRIDNTGILLAPNSAATPERVVLGGTKHTTNPIRLGLYLTRVR
ncbi:DUF4270 family protein [Hymenobacter wooponensis]|uniref:DUF4270 family protein n=1 Tax=Hymenobacter wooponensis TaxID=1525360 RepID=A0A4Z0MJB5_9BACT|nr:DUF4270 family protein [Hymenobacter wooponensis]TGD79596.1 DUF4270 family protein [Hymenobacter wooponensis]